MDIEIDVVLPDGMAHSDECSVCDDDNLAVVITTETLHHTHLAPLCFKCFEVLYLKGRKISMGE